MAYYIVNFSDVSKVNITDLFHFSNPKCGFDARFEHIEYVDGDPSKGWVINEKSLNIGDMFSVYHEENEVAIIEIIDTCEKILFPEAAPLDTIVVSDTTESKDDVIDNTSFNAIIDDNNLHISQYSISYAPLVIPIYVRLIHWQNAKTWDGIECSRFSNIQESFLAEFYDYREGQFFTEEARAFIKSKKLDGLINQKLSKLNFRFHRGIIFECRILNIIPYLKQNNQIIFSDKNKEFLHELETKRYTRLPSSISDPNFATEVTCDIVSPSGCEKIKFEKVNSLGIAEDQHFLTIVLDLDYGRENLSTLNNSQQSSDTSKAFRLLLNARRELHIKKIFLNVRKKILLSEKQIDIQAGINTNINIDKSKIPLADYQLFGTLNTKVSICFIFADNTEYTVELQNNTGALSYRIENSWVANADNRYGLFVDMGSTFTKYVFLPLNNSGQVDMAQFSHKDKHYMSTERFLQKFNISLPTNCSLQNIKSEMSRNSETFADFLLAAIGSIAQSPELIVKKDETGTTRKLIEFVSWSFPKCEQKKNFFDDVSEKVRKRISEWVVCNKPVYAFDLVPEHEALKEMFVGCLEAMSELVSIEYKNLGASLSDKDRQADDKIRNSLANGNDMNLTLWGNIIKLRWTKNRREKAKQKKADKINEETRRRINDVNKEEKERLREKFYNDFKCLLQFALVAQKRFDRLLLLDAGGYTVDAFCRIPEPAWWLPTLNQSHAFPGEKLRSMLVKYARDEKNITINDATANIWLQEYGELEDIQIKGAVDNVFIELYKSLVDHVKEGSGELDVLVLSGGVSQNQAFVSLFKDIRSYIYWDISKLFPDLDFEIKGKICIISSETIYKILESLQSNLKCLSWVSFFENLVITSNNGEKGTSACSSYDIVGGMMQRKIKFYNTTDMELNFIPKK